MELEWIRFYIRMDCLVWLPLFPLCWKNVQTGITESQNRFIPIKVRITFYVKLLKKFLYMTQVGFLK